MQMRTWKKSVCIRGVLIRILLWRALLCLHINYTQLGVARVVKTNTHKLAGTKTSDTNCTLLSLLLACCIALLVIAINQ